MSCVVTEELEEAQRQVKKSADESNHLQTQLLDAQRTAKDQTDHASELQGQGYGDTQKSGIGYRADYRFAPSQ